MNYYFKPIGIFYVETILYDVQRWWVKYIVAGDDSDTHL